ncbi:hypothetical protein Q3G72_029044 [Acer saccharum]|nr:hypothetical protein Q3G72_029044 [Acer saccharum]
MWTKFPECEDLISSSWKENATASGLNVIQEKINKCAVNLSSWSRHRFGGNGRRIKCLKKELEAHLNGAEVKAALDGMAPSKAPVRRRLDVHDCCPVCHNSSESIPHLFWQCCRAVEVWRILLGDKVFQSLSASEFPEVAVGLSSSVNRDKLHLFVIGCWRLWTNRNNIVHGAAGWEAADLVAWIVNFAAEFREANEFNHKEILSYQPVWKPPALGGFKINCDASFRLRSGKAGIGVIIRDHMGNAIAAKSSPVQNCSSVEMLEAHACLEGLQLAFDVGISGVILESDAAGVIKLLSDHVIPHSELGSIIRASLSLGSSVNLLSSEAVRRGANSVAHSLAQLALSLDGSSVWLDGLPPDIYRLVCFDSSSIGCPV